MDAAMAALSALGDGGERGTIVMDEAAQGAYVEAVRAGLMATFGVPAPDGLDRLIRAAAVASLSPEGCVAFIGDHFELEALPPRIQSRSRSS